MATAIYEEHSSASAPDVDVDSNRDLSQVVGQDVE